MGGSGTGKDTDGIKADYMVPQGLSAVILAVSIFFGITSLGVVSLRLWIRGRANILGWDDGLMAMGLALFLVAAGMASYDTFQGLGTPTDLVDGDMEIVGLKVSNPSLSSILVIIVLTNFTVCHDLAALLHGVAGLHQEQHLRHHAANRHSTRAPMGTLRYRCALHGGRTRRIHWHVVRMSSRRGSVGRRRPMCPSKHHCHSQLHHLSRRHRHGLGVCHHSCLYPLERADEEERQALCGHCAGTGLVGIAVHHYPNPVSEIL